MEANSSDSRLVYVLKKKDYIHSCGHCRKEGKLLMCRFCNARFCSNLCIGTDWKNPLSKHKETCRVVAPFIFVESILLKYNALTFRSDMVSDIAHECKESNDFRTIQSRREGVSLSESRIREILSEYKPYFPMYWKMIGSDPVYIESLGLHLRDLTILTSIIG